MTVYDEILAELRRSNEILQKIEQKFRVTTAEAAFLEGYQARRNGRARSAPDEHVNCSLEWHEGWEAADLISRDRAAGR